MIRGLTLTYWRTNSNPVHFINMTINLFKCLLNRGHTYKQLQLKFINAVKRLTSKADCEEAYDNHSYLGGDLELTALSATPRPR